MNSMFQSEKLWMFFILLLACCSPSPREEKPDREYDDYEIADPSAPGASDKPGTHFIEIIQMKFVPEVMNVKKGDKVIWVNNDLVEHDVTEESGKAWASPKLKPGESWEMIFTKSEVYYCNLHVVMKGKVVVDEADIAMLDSEFTMCK